MEKNFVPYISTSKDGSFTARFCKLTLAECQARMQNNHGHLDLRLEKDITELPDNLVVVGNLDISNSNIERLPNNLTVKGCFNMIGTKISEIPANCNFCNYIWAQNSELSKLPDNWTVYGNLNLKNTPIRRLPDTLTVHGYLGIQRTNIENIPKHLLVKTKIYCSEDSPLVNLAFEGYKVEIE